MEKRGHTCTFGPSRTSGVWGWNHCNIESVGYESGQAGGGIFREDVQHLENFAEDEL